MDKKVKEAKASLEDLRKKHEAYIAKAKKEGENVRPIACPHCWGLWENINPKKKGASWDSMTICPLCGLFSFAVFRHDRTSCYVGSEQNSLVRQSKAGPVITFFGDIRK